MQNNFPLASLNLKHGDKVICPCCGFPGTLDLEGNAINFEDSVWFDVTDSEWRCVLMLCK